jgi:hypothetical protein
MAYGHAERTLAAIRLLEAETRQLLGGLPALDREQSRWLQEVTATGSQQCQLALAELPAPEAAMRPPDPCNLPVRATSAAMTTAMRGPGWFLRLPCAR